VTEKQKARLKETIQLIEQQCEKLKDIEREYAAEYNVLFDRHGAMESVKRWCDRTAKIIGERVSVAEAGKFQRLPTSLSALQGSRRFMDWLGQFDTFLVRLRQDICEHPDDPSYVELLEPRTIKSEEGGIAEEVQLPAYDVFLSYSSHDKDEARKIYGKVGQVGKKCFLAEKSILPGDTFTDKIRDALNASKEVWILLSPASIKSAWVTRERDIAWGLRKLIVPILLRCSHADLPDILKNTHAIDYHNIDSLISNFGPVHVGRASRQTSKRQTATFRTTTGHSSKVFNNVGDINVNPRITRKNIVNPGPEHVSPAQALEIKTRVLEIAELETKSGRKMMPGAWYNKLYKQFDITSYHLTPASRFDEVISWLQKQAVLIRPKLRRTDPEEWSKSLYKGIWSRAKELGMSKDQVHAFAGSVLQAGAPPSSLSELGERNLKTVYDALFRRPKQ